MNAAPPASTLATRSSRAWSGPALLAVAAAQLLLGDTLLASFPARPFSMAGAVGLLLTMGSTLTLIAGLGEMFNWLAARFSRR